MSCARWFARASLLAILFAGLPAAESAAADRFCDPSFEDCRALTAMPGTSIACMWPVSRSRYPRTTLGVGLDFRLFFAL